MTTSWSLLDSLERVDSIIYAQDECIHNIDRISAVKKHRFQHHETFALGAMLMQETYGARENRSSDWSSFSKQQDSPTRYRRGPTFTIGSSQLRCSSLLLLCRWPNSRVESRAAPGQRRS